jgi:hypothetical protein
LSLNVCFRGKADIEVKVFTSPFDQSGPQWHDLRIHDDAQHSSIVLIFDAQPIIHCRGQPGNDFD